MIVERHTKANQIEKKKKSYCCCSDVCLVKRSRFLCACGEMHRIFE